MSGTGDLRAVLADAFRGDVRVEGGDGDLLLSLIVGRQSDVAVAALAAADEPLTATVECDYCHGTGKIRSGSVLRESYHPCPRCADGTVRGGWFTEDVLRARLRKIGRHWGWRQSEIDQMVRALIGGAT